MQEQRMNFSLISPDGVRARHMSRDYRALTWYITSRQRLESEYITRVVCEQMRWKKRWECVCWL